MICPFINKKRQTHYRVDSTKKRWSNIDILLCVYMTSTSLPLCLPTKLFRKPLVNHFHRYGPIVIYSPAGCASRGRESLWGLWTALHTNSFLRCSGTRKFSQACASLGLESLLGDNRPVTPVNNPPTSDVRHCATKPHYQIPSWKRGG